MHSLKPFHLVFLIIITVLVVIFNCAKTAHPNTIYIQTDHHKQHHVQRVYDDCREYNPHIPKRLRYGRREEVIVCFPSRERHKHHLSRERHEEHYWYEYRRPLTPRERYMRDKVLREGGEW